MIIRSDVDRGKRLANLISNQLNELDLASTDRTRLAAACFFVAMEHHTGIIDLFERGNASSATALLRPLYEAYIRGSWIHLCASDEQIEAFKTGADRPKIPKIACLLEHLENLEAFDERHLSREHGKNWSALCGLTHTGIEQILLCLRPDSIERNCPPDLIVEALGYAGRFSLLSSIGVAHLANADELANRLLEITKEFVAT